ncbi:MAG: MBL fold metallo-hydrolase [Deltaproteobacteria bacterium]|nr:MBL fold metallo-hydrolase [Deltaproteobacteria bacterium]MBN2687805.1 MBL fold metallo-hydrolase [Deltaproteobacteria bacterium]
MKVTILYDNTAWSDDLKADWGFACLVEAYGRTILFDTGASGPILLGNMKKMNVDPTSVDDVFISHAHWDHTGGLVDFLRVFNDLRLIVPSSCDVPGHVAREVVSVRQQIAVADNIYSTGELKGIEQALAVETGKGVAIIVGCSHPGLGEIIDAASTYGNVVAVIGGLHGFNEYGMIKNLELICATHCTQHISGIRSLYPDRFMEGGAGRVIEL